MIRRVALTNWRAYDQLDLQIGPGTTFVVAPNGVGKSSLVEAASWALFGESAGSPHGAVRLGTDQAAALAEVELPDGRALTVRRRLGARPTRTPSVPEASVDGRPVPAGALDDLLRDAFQADPVFLARLAMLRWLDDPKQPPVPDLRTHLCRYFGVDGLQRTVDLLDARLKDTDRRIRQIKKVSGPGLKELREMRAARDEAAEAAQAARAAHATASALARDARTAFDDAVRNARWREQEAERLARLAEIAAAISGDSEPIDPGSAAEVLAARETELQAVLDRLRAERGLALGRADAVRSAAAKLDDAAGDCPVCLRPLDEHDKDRARAEHRRALAAAEAVAADAARQEQQTERQLAAARTAAAEARALAIPAPRPAAGDPDADETAAAEAAEAADAARHLAEAALVEA
ncbi:MAG TPA: AAA family ATPase, partial [Mycobacteriales bacterium]|nr:AAA family ATPase [Mycobacteriales bacterium]